MEKMIQHLKQNLSRLIYSKRSTYLLCIISTCLLFNLNTVKGQESDWVSLPQGVNGSVNCLLVYNNELIAGGHFTEAGEVDANKIASWNGSEWSALGSGVAGLNDGFVTNMIVFQDDLYAAGSFTQAGETEANNIARWDGAEWTAVGAGTNNAIYSMAVYNNELVIGGIFTTAGGEPASRIAQWDGSTWHSLGSGIEGNNVNDLYVFQNELYAVGPFDAAGDTPSNNIARWNGTEWNNVSSGVGIGNTAMIEWDNQLLVGSELNVDFSEITQIIHQWDGDNWSVFSDQSIFPVRKFLMFDEKLYCSGGIGAALSEGMSVVAEWSGNSWNIVGTGINNHTSALCEFNGELYCGGSFNVSDDAYHNYIARLSDAVGIISNSDDEKVQVYPNPFSHKFDIQINSFTPGQEIMFTVYDVSGKQLYSTPILAPLTTVTDFNNTGLSFWQVTKNGDLIQAGKLIGLN